MSTDVSKQLVQAVQLRVAQHLEQLREELSWEIQSRRLHRECSSGNGSPALYEGFSPMTVALVGHANPEHVVPHLPSFESTDAARASMKFQGHATTVRRIEQQVHTSMAVPMFSRFAVLKKTQEQQRQGFLWRLVKQPMFHAVVGFVILLNVAALIVRTELQPEKATGRLRPWWYLELVFVLFYLLEVCIKVCAMGSDFCFGHGCAWHWFDLALVSIAMFELFVDWVAGVAAFRLLYPLRLVKVLRVIRLMRAFRELRLMLDSMLGSIRAVIWSLALLLSIMLMFALLFVQAFRAVALEDPTFQISDVEGAINYSTLGRSMFTLFSACTGGADWEDLAAPLMFLGWRHYGFFIMYIGIFQFVLANCVTGLIVDSIMAIAHRDEYEIIAEHMEQKESHMKRLVTLFDSMDRDESGEVSMQEFVKFLKDKRMQAFAGSLEIETDDLEQFFAILSDGGRRSVDLETFVVGNIKLRGMARSMDLVDLLTSHKRAVEHQNVFMAFVDESFSQIFAMLDELNALSRLSTGAAGTMPTGPRGSVASMGAIPEAAQTLLAAPDYAASFGCADVPSEPSASPATITPPQLWSAFVKSV